MIMSVPKDEPVAYICNRSKTHSHQVLILGISRIEYQQGNKQKYFSEVQSEKYNKCLYIPIMEIEVGCFVAEK